MNAIAYPVSAPSKPIGLLAKAYCKKSLPLEVLQSARGFYIGTSDEGFPCSRESVQYWTIRTYAESALANGMWTQRSEP